MQNKTIILGKTTKDSLTLAFVRIVTLSVGILQTMILARGLSKTEYGTYSEGLLIISTFGPFFSLGLHDSVNYFYNKEEKKELKESYVNTIFFVSIMAGILCCILILLGKGIIVDYFHNLAIGYAILYIAIRPCFINLTSLFQPIYISIGKAKTIAHRNLSISFVQILIVSIVYFLSLNARDIFLLLLIADFFQIVVFWIILKKKYFVINPFKVEKSLIKEILRYSLPLMVAVSMGTIALNIDKIMVSKFLSVEEFALYSVVSKELPIDFVVNSYTAIITPYIVVMLRKKQIDLFKSVWKKYIELGYIITWALGVAAVVLAPEIIRLLYSERYVSKQGILVFRLYMFVSMMRFTYFGLIPSALGKTKLILYYSFVGCVINILLNYPMYMLVGVQGPAIATLLSIGIQACLYFISGAKLLDIKITDVISYSNILLYIAELFIVGIVAREIMDFLNRNLNQLLLAVPTFVAIFLTLILLNYKKLVSIIHGLNNEVER